MSASNGSESWSRFEELYNVSRYPSSVPNPSIRYWGRVIVLFTLNVKFPMAEQRVNQNNVYMSLLVRTFCKCNIYFTIFWSNGVTICPSTIDLIEPANWHYNGSVTYIDKYTIMTSIVLSLTLAALIVSWFSTKSNPVKSSPETRLEATVSKDLTILKL